MYIQSVESVSKIKSIISNLFDEMYGDVCLQLIHLSLDDCENVCTLSVYHNQIRNMNN